MEATVNLTSRGSSPRSMLTDDQYIIIMETSAEVGTVLAVVGVVSNVVSIRTFTAMGCSDGVTTSFLALAVFDLVYLIASVCLAVSVMFYFTELRSGTRFFWWNLSGFFLFFGGVMILINITNMLATTYLAVARCMCVAKPLQFRNTFTHSRAIMFVMSFAVFAIIIYTPILSNMGMVDKFDRSSNTSRPSFWVSHKRDSIKEVVWIVTEMILPILTQIITLVCVVIMSRSLQAASRFRQSSVFKRSFDVEKGRFNHLSASKDKANCVNDSNNGDKLSGKDLRVVQQVVLISVVYIACNIPKILISFATIFKAEFTIGKIYTKLYLSVNGLRKHFEVINAAVNLVIYYKYNSKFRATLCHSQ